MTLKSTTPKKITFSDTCLSLTKPNQTFITMKDFFDMHNLPSIEDIPKIPNIKMSFDNACRIQEILKLIDQVEELEQHSHLIIPVIIQTNTYLSDERISSEEFDQIIKIISKLKHDRYDSFCSFFSIYNSKTKLSFDNLQKVSEIVDIFDSDSQADIMRYIVSIYNNENFDPARVPSIINSLLVHFSGTNLYFDQEIPLPGYIFFDNYCPSTPILFHKAIQRRTLFKRFIKVNGKKYDIYIKGAFGINTGSTLGYCPEISRLYGIRILNNNVCNYRWKRNAQENFEKWGVSATLENSFYKAKL
ncbi:hypothetical protein KO465_08600 [Candidatus Micrarchaeota archaeon]|nr:hypothetical protein [Candidatus Micrarchaeota archaeon]